LGCFGGLDGEIGAGMGTGIFDGLRLGFLSCLKNMLGLIISPGNGSKLKAFMKEHSDFSPWKGSR
jgi:hypothetical protein